MEVIKVTAPAPIEPSPVALRCPGCRHQSTFQPPANVKDFRLTQAQFGGQRVCSTPGCNTHVFVVHDGSGEVTEAYPPELLDFDSTNLPTTVHDSLQEALKCHASSCFKASAMMVRRTLEELCEDRGIAGEDPKTGDTVSLKKRLNALRGVVVLPETLFEALQDLRLLGNDAAHVVSKDYNEIGQEQVEVAIDLTKEVLKAVYQLTSLVDRLKALKKPEASA